MNEWLETIARLLNQNVWIAPVLCLAAGVITSFTPCSLSTIPMVLTYVGATAKENLGRAFSISLTMALGMACTFGVFGSIASAIGHVMHHAGEWWSILLGILMILMALQTWGVIHIVPHVHLEGDNKKKGYIGAFLTGALGGVFASHCATPVMIALLAMVAKADKGTLWGIFLMILYAVGHSVLMVAAGTAYSSMEAIINNEKYLRAGNILKTVLGFVILAVGLVIIFFRE
ncbi:MAG: cytochrome c biogenesis protein CcdA [Lachnospiraceae bacterium]|nr:cytochrome c biogenesis protein CcdA [Lachnospiraceae bacterium]MCI9545138.1 cytochrome c biogenesis protein CcdA [Lachnospiraceae bacterium]